MVRPRLRLCSFHRDLHNRDYIFSYLLRRQKEQTRHFFQYHSARYSCQLVFTFAWVEILKRLSSTSRYFLLQAFYPAPCGLWRKRCGLSPTKLFQNLSHSLSSQAVQVLLVGSCMHHCINYKGEGKGPQITDNIEANAKADELHNRVLRCDCRQKKMH